MQNTHLFGLFALWIGSLQAANWYLRQAYQQGYEFYVSLFLVCSFLGGFVALFFRKFAQPAYSVERFFAGGDVKWSTRVSIAAGTLFAALICLSWLFYPDPALQQTILARRINIPLDLMHTLSKGPTWEIMLKLFLLYAPLVVFYPVLEELLFRGLLLCRLKEHLNPWLARICVTCLFVIQHDIFSQGVGYAAKHATSHFVWGLIYLWLAERGGNLKPAITVHVMKNLMVVAIGLRSYFPQ